MKTVDELAAEFGLAPDALEMIHRAIPAFDPTTVDSGLRYFAGRAIGGGFAQYGISPGDLRAAIVQAHEWTEGEVRRDPEASADSVRLACALRLFGRYGSVWASALPSIAAGLSTT